MRKIVTILFVMLAFLVKAPAMEIEEESHIPEKPFYLLGHGPTDWDLEKKMMGHSKTFK